MSQMPKVNTHEQYLNFHVMNKSVTGDLMDLIDFWDI